MPYIAFDAHKHYTLASGEREDGRRVRAERIPHERGKLRQFLARWERGSPVALETIGNWYWIVDEIEAAEHGASHGSGGREGVWPRGTWASKPRPRGRRAGPARTVRWTV